MWSLRWRSASLAQSAVSRVWQQARCAASKRDLQRDKVAVSAAIWELDRRRGVALKYKVSPMMRTARMWSRTFMTSDGGTITECVRNTFAVPRWSRRRQVWTCKLRLTRPPSLAAGQRHRPLVSITFENGVVVLEGDSQVDNEPQVVDTESKHPSLNDAMHDLSKFGRMIMEIPYRDVQQWKPKYESVKEVTTGSVQRKDGSVKEVGALRLRVAMNALQVDRKWGRRGAGGAKYFIPHNTFTVRHGKRHSEANWSRCKHDGTFESVRCHVLVAKYTTSSTSKHKDLVWRVRASCNFRSTDNPFAAIVLADGKVLLATPHQPFPAAVEIDCGKGCLSDVEAVEKWGHVHGVVPLDNIRKPVAAAYELDACEEEDRRGDGDSASVSVGDDDEDDDDHQ